MKRQSDLDLSSPHDGPLNSDSVLENGFANISDDGISSISNMTDLCSRNKPSLSYQLRYSNKLLTLFSESDNSGSVNSSKQPHSDDSRKSNAISSIEDFRDIHKETTMRKLFNRVSSNVKTDSNVFDYQPFELSFKDPQIRIRFQRYMVLQQHPWSIYVGVAIPVFAVVSYYISVHVNLYRYYNVPLSLTIIGIIAFLVLAGVALMYISAVRLCTREFHIVAQEEVKAQVDAEGKAACEDDDEQQCNDEQADVLSSHDTRFRNIFHFSLFLYLFFLTILCYHGIVRALYLECLEMCMQTLPMQNLVWVAIFYGPMHAVLIVPLTWPSILGCEFYSKACVLAVFYAHGGPELFVQNLQVISLFAWMWLTWLAAVYYMYQRQMVVFIQREQLMAMAAKETQNSISKNLLWTL